MTDRAGFGFYPEQRDEAHECARSAGGIVLSLPVDGDYRSDDQTEPQPPRSSR